MPWSDEDSRNLERLADKVSPRQRRVHSTGRDEPGCFWAIGGFMALCLAMEYRPFSNFLARVLTGFLEAIFG